MSVDFSANKLYYPKAIKGGERNDNFSTSENFVVFECVNRLLEKGYRPEHIELEKQWNLGHDPKKWTSGHLRDRRKWVNAFYS